MILGFLFWHYVRAKFRENRRTSFVWGPQTVTHTHTHRQQAGLINRLLVLMREREEAGNSLHKNSCMTWTIIKIDNSSFEMVEEFPYLGTTITNQNSMQEEIKSRLKSGNACCHSVQYHLSSSLLSKNLKIKIYRTIILPVVWVWNLVTHIEGGT